MKTRLITATALAAATLTGAGWHTHHDAATQDRVSMSAATEAVRTFPLRHMLIQPPHAIVPHAPQHTLWVTIDDGTALSGDEEGRAIPDHSGTTPSVECSDEGHGNTLCQEDWTVTPNEVRLHATWRGQQCYLIGSRISDTPTRLTCSGQTLTL